MPDPTMAVAALAAAVPVAVLGLVVWHECRGEKRAEKAIRAEKMWRSAGYLLRLELEALFRKAVAQLVWATLLCALAGGLAGWTAHLFAAPVPRLFVLLPGVLLPVTAGAGLCLAWGVVRSLRQAAALRRRFRCEQAVAEVLHQVADSGYRIFHDFPQPLADLSHAPAPSHSRHVERVAPAPNGAARAEPLGHIAVGPQGVFLIQAHLPAGAQSQNGNHSPPVVQVAERVLRFPSETDGETLPKAELAARRLSAFLLKKTGKPVPVEPLVILPGWFVQSREALPAAKPRGRPKRGQRDSQPEPFKTQVLNTLGLPEHLRRQPRKLKPAQLRQLLWALDEKCRDVEL